MQHKQFLRHPNSKDVIVGNLIESFIPFLDIKSLKIKFPWFITFSNIITLLFFSQYI